MKLSIILFVILFISCSADPTRDIKKVSGTLALERDSTQISFLHEGSGDTCLIFLHGWNISKEYWQNQISEFARNYSIYAIDLPGFGESTSVRTNWTIESYGQDVAGFIAQLNLQNVILIGHSMSGAIALETALLSKDEVIGIIGVDNFKMVGLENPPELEKQINDFAEQLRRNYAEVASGYANSYLFHERSDSVSKARVANDYANANQEVAISTFLSLVDHAKVEEKELSELWFKLYLIQSAGMPTSLPGLEKNLVYGYEIEEIAEVGHFPMIEKPAEFNGKLKIVLGKV